MESISNDIMYVVGLFIVPIFVAIVEFIINKSNGNKFGYTITKTVLGIQIVVMLVTIFNR